MTSLFIPALPAFALLLLGHVLADFMLQANWMVRHKRNAFVLLLHIAVVFVVTTLALGGVWQVALPVALAHLLIDLVKTYALPARIRDGFAAFIIDQAAHIAVLAYAALTWPRVLEAGFLAPYAGMLVIPALAVSGLVVTVIAGGFAVGMITARFAEELTMNGPEQDGLRDAGRVIGQLERGMIFLLIFIGQPAGIGFLIAAKSILRFDTAVQQRAGEYVIIGTLASFTWAMASGYATLELIRLVTP